MNAARLFQNVLALVYPQQNECHLCSRALEAGDGCLCAACAGRLNAGSIPRQDMFAPHAPLFACLSAYYHDGEARRLCHLLKYQGDALAALPLAEGMSHALVLAGLTADIAVPVPLHPARQRERGYNQAALLARELCGHTGLPICESALRRVTHTRTQLSRTRAARLEAMRGAFMADAALVTGKTVLLVDDVLTTGATAAACAGALLQSGAARVALITACRA